MEPATSPLLTDLYQINMIQAYLDHGDTKTAVFELFARTLPARTRGNSARIASIIIGTCPPATSFIAGAVPR